MDDLDQREALRRAFPDCGPDWRAAIEYGIDVTLLERNLTLTVEQRLAQLHEMTKLYELLRPENRDAEHA